MTEGSETDGIRPQHVENQQGACQGAKDRLRFDHFSTQYAASLRSWRRLVFDHLVDVRRVWNEFLVI